MELDLQVCPEEIMSRTVELGCESWTSFASSCCSTAVQRTLSLDPQPRRDHEQGGGAGLRKLDFFRFELFLNSNATDIDFVTLPKHGS